MNIKLTKEEAVSMLRDHLSEKFPFSIAINDVEIVGGKSIQSGSSNDTQVTVNLMELVRAAHAPSQVAHGTKIAAIKSVRDAARQQGIYLWLADIKEFVEIWWDK